jgi:glucose-1-phosphate thymidylyltransferase
MKLMCPEEIAFEFGYLDEVQLLAAADRMGSSDYANFLRRRAAEGRLAPANETAAQKY